ncbi:CBU_0592 family membrane protein [Parvularcula sp. LCG005]|uniref:CBU_0592 family membrane protein n=1 Tax=Parvularcula sp. LCG005 TaxID=3078805 RepID=UPI0029437017|nr:hypothetical protein [Parvularcula sp. LCG005]WOI54223.1 hypothetical protein RUI03_04300 [Parvularcula sp. LCG005]
MTADLLGWAGFALYILAQAYITWVRDANRTIYYTMNLFGALGYTISSALLYSWQSVSINVFWFIVSALMLMGITPTGPLRVVRTPLVAIVGLMALAAAAIWPTSPDWGRSILGWDGALLYCAGYALFASKVIRRKLYLVMNTAAPIMLLPIYLAHHNDPAVGMSVVWAIISAAGVWHLRHRPMGWSTPPET